MIHQPDYFVHKYQYDAENRLTDVETGRDKMVWEKDARYFYYKHGPLARTILGQNQVQGIDYAYTLQGWLKGVNSTAVGDGTWDMGSDGKIAGVNSNIGRDAYGFSLNYFGNDYKPIGNTNPFVAISIAKDLFNGNIKAMAVNIPKLDTAKVYGYQYDQLNRLVAMDAYNGLNNTTNIFTPGNVEDYKERIAYDANGNILKYFRNGTTVGGTKLGMDSLSYKYFRNEDGTLRNNRLRMVRDSISPGNYSEDIDDQLASVANAADSNYLYDEIGNLIADASEGISNITWTVYGKISTITKTDGTNIAYTYDASGNRISKNVNDKETWYIRDATGNVMSIYSKDASINSGDLTQTEIHLYGSSRLGVYNLKNNVEHLDLNTGRILTFTRGNKFFELSNHLGNVLVTVSDRKLQYSSDNVRIDYYAADVVSAHDYYPFGMLMPGRKYSVVNTNYRYGFNGKEKSNEIENDNYDFGSRILDTRLGGRWFSLDPLQRKYPNESNYIFTSGNPIIYADVDGRDKIYTLTVIGKDGKRISQKVVDKNFFIYTENKVEGFFNPNHFYKSDLNVNITIDNSGETGQITVLAFERNQKEISRGDYRIQQISSFITNFMKPNDERGSQAGGFSFTSEFAQSIDGPKTDATKGSSGSVSIDGIMAAFNAVKMSPEAPKFIIDDLPEWVTLGKDLAEQTLQNKNKQTKMTNTERGESSWKDYPHPGIKPGTVVNFGPTNSKKINDSIWKPTSESATDTSPVWKGYKGSTESQK